MDPSLTALLGIPAAALAGGALAWYFARPARRGLWAPMGAAKEGAAKEGVDRESRARERVAREGPTKAGPTKAGPANTEPANTEPAKTGLGRDDGRAKETDATYPAGDTADLAFHRLVAANVPDVVMRLDSNCARIFVSSACQKVFGWDAATILARPGFDMVHPDDRDSLHATLAALSPLAPASEGSWRGVHRDGRTIWIEAQYRHIAADGGVLAILRDVTRRKLAEERLIDALARADRAAAADPATGLPDRSVFEATAARLLAGGTDLAVLHIAMDWDRGPAQSRAAGGLGGRSAEGQARRHNDPADTAIPREAAARLTRALSREPLVAALADTGFGVLMRVPDGDQGVAAQTRDLLRLLCEPYGQNGETVDATAVVGIATGPRDGACIASLSRKAGLALVRAREAGAASYRFYEPAMGEAAALDRDLRAALPGAIAAGQIVPWFQPIVRLAGGEVAGFEVLARWEHPTLGLLEPASFVPLAEDSGMAGALSRAILRQACLVARAWPQDIVLSINLSPLDLRDTALPGDLAAILAETGFDGTRLEVEIREDGLSLESHATRSVLDGLRIVGVSVALDDFGTGHSGLDLVRELPLDKVKIDGSLVRPLAQGSENNRFFRAIVELSHAMGLEVVAKGIEAGATLDCARILGCTYGQGDWVRPPMPVPDLSPAFDIGGRRPRH